jgi:hypothetical protein
MNANLTPYIRLFLFLVIQVVLLKRIHIGEGAFNHIHLFLYPLSIMLFPFAFSRTGLLFLAFVSGLLMDFFYNSPGVNAAAATLLAFSRPYLFKILEPRGGYGMSSTPTSHSMGANWFFSYIALATLVYILTFFSLHAFTLVFILQILLKTVFSLVFSLIIMGVYTLMFNPKS